ncbi:hypothetical protein BCR35DRAFT_328165 [Leucosporidium creatinivorum]|uniref:DUF1754-domain-containing protein n=1 Tax=Leucosporidium creatinivorum TaxID=106004 RepID=A0A1Y2G3N0_9BASI|nr:hypothetical protein BCR35DRAFT_328165 [Leucosporidium creatinivorum]
MAGGSLKLKGTPAGPSNKKKKKSSTTKRLREEEGAGSGSGSGGEREGSAAQEDQHRGESPSTSTATSLSGKTEAQRKFEEVQKKRLLEKAAKLANKSHKERVAEFNEKLEAMSEHHDIPRVGPG